MVEGHRRHPLDCHPGKRGTRLSGTQGPATRPPRHVTRYGVRLLPHFVERLNPVRAWEAIELEAAVAEALRRWGLLAWTGGS